MRKPAGILKLRTFCKVMGQNITQLHVQVTPRKKEGEEKNPKDYQKKIRRLYQLYRLNASNVFR